MVSIADLLTKAVARVLYHELLRLFDAYMYAVTGEVLTDSWEERTVGRNWACACNRVSSSPFRLRDETGEKCVSVCLRVCPVVS